MQYQKFTHISFNKVFPTFTYFVMTRSEKADFLVIFCRFSVRKVLILAAAMFRGMHFRLKMEIMFFFPNYVPLFITLNQHHLNKKHELSLMT